MCPACEKSVFTVYEGLFEDLVLRVVGREDVVVKHEIHVIGVCLIRLKDGVMITCGKIVNVVQ